MMKNLKYKDIQERLPALSKPLLDSIQTAFLEIRQVDRSCEKFQSISSQIPELQECKYVVFSRFMKKKDRHAESFVFLGERGETLRHVSGRELELYGLLEGCDLELNDEFDCNWHVHSEA